MNNNRTAMMKDFTSFVESLKTTAKHAQTKALRYMALLEEAKKIKGSKWVNVDKVELKKDVLYIIRRIERNVVKCPCLAYWNDGWDIVHGSMNPSPPSPCRVEVVWR